MSRQQRLDQIYTTLKKKYYGGTYTFDQFMYHVTKLVKFYKELP